MVDACHAGCDFACSVITDACKAGLGALVGCAKLENLAATAVCAAAVAAACKLGADPVTCSKYLCGPICGCKADEQLCVASSTSFALCRPINTNVDCGACGDACQAPKVCAGDVLNGFSCQCPGKCPDPTFADPTTCKCTCPDPSPLDPPCPPCATRDISNNCQCTAPPGMSLCGDTCCSSGDQCVGGYCHSACPPGFHDCGKFETRCVPYVKGLGCCDPGPGFDSFGLATGNYCRGSEMATCCPSSSYTPFFPCVPCPF